MTDSKSWWTKLWEIIGCSVYVSWFFVLSPLCLFWFFALLFSPLFFLPCLYLAWFIYDKKTPYRAGRRSKFVREFFLWRHMVNYFPVFLHKTADLEPSKNYIIGHHPHGVLFFENTGHFGTEHTGFSKAYPGITVHPLTLQMNFLIPFLREVTINMGFGSVSADSINYKLTKMGKGNAVVIIVGGAAEAKLADPDNPYRLVLKNRKGFVKMALKTGACLVPAFTFGETSLYHQYKPLPGSLFFKLQSFFHKTLKFAPILFYGRYFFLPDRIPLHTIIGAPIDIPTVKEPSQEDIDKYHEVYVKALRKLFDENVKTYGDPTKQLEIL